MSSLVGMPCFVCATDRTSFHLQSDAFVFYSGLTEEQMIPGYRMIIEKLTEPGFDKLYVSKKYSRKRFLEAASFALDWARNHCGKGLQMTH
jgi:hypothetical protein